MMRNTFWVLRNGAAAFACGNRVKNANAKKTGKSREAATDGSPRRKPWVAGAELQKPCKGERKPALNVRDFSAAPPGLVADNAPNPRLTPWATVLRHSVAGLGATARGLGKKRRSIITLGDQLESTYCLSQLRMSFISNLQKRLSIFITS